MEEPDSLTLHPLAATDTQLSGSPARFCLQTPVGRVGLLPWPLQTTHKEAGSLSILCLIHMICGLQICKAEMVLLALALL